MADAERVFATAANKRITSSKLLQAYFRAAVRNEKPVLAKRLIVQLLQSVPNESVEDVGAFVSFMLDLGLLDEVLEVVKLGMLQGTRPASSILERLLVDGQAKDRDDLVQQAIEGLSHQKEVGVETLHAALAVAKRNSLPARLSPRPCTFTM